MRPNRIIRYLLPFCIAGFALAVAFVLVLVGFDVLGLRTMAQRSEVGGLMIGLLVFMNGLTFASALMGIAVMALGHRKDDDDEDDDLKGGGGPRLKAPARVPVPVRVRAAGPRTR